MRQVVYVILSSDRIHLWVHTCPCFEAVEQFFRKDFSDEFNLFLSYFCRFFETVADCWLYG